MEDLIGCLVDVYRIVVPGFRDEVDSVGDNQLSNVASRFVQNKIKMVFTQKRVRRIRFKRIVEDFILVVVIDDFP